MSFSRNAVQFDVRIPVRRLESDFLTASVSEPDPDIPIVRVKIAQRSGSLTLAVRKSVSGEEERVW